MLDQYKAFELLICCHVLIYQYTIPGTSHYKYTHLAYTKYTVL